MMMMMTMMIMIPDDDDDDDDDDAWWWYIPMWWDGIPVCYSTIDQSLCVSHMMAQRLHLYFDGHFTLR